MLFQCAGLVPNSTVDGPGLRMSVFTQGCLHECPECHNPHTWALTNGYKEDTDKILSLYEEDNLLDGITLTGGEPFLQADEMYVLAKGVHQRGGNVWAYSGYTLYELQCIARIIKGVNRFLKEIDVLVDGPFVSKLKDENLLWRGSSNQKIWRQIEGNWSILLEYDKKQC